MPVNREDPTWQPTHAGRSYSAAYGYGKLDAGLLVENARHFVRVSQQGVCETGYVHTNALIPETDKGLQLHYDGNRCRLARIEHVQVTVSIRHTYRPDVQIELVSPNNVTSVLVRPRARDLSPDGFNGNVFMSVAHW